MQTSRTSHQRTGLGSRIILYKVIAREVIYGVNGCVGTGKEVGRFIPSPSVQRLDSTLSPLYLVPPYRTLRPTSTTSPSRSKKRPSSSLRTEAAMSRVNTAFVVATPRTHGKWSNCGDGDAEPTQAQRCQNTLSGARRSWGECPRYEPCWKLGRVVIISGSVGYIVYEFTIPLICTQGFTSTQGCRTPDSPFFLPRPISRASPRRSQNVSRMQTRPRRSFRIQDPLPRFPPLHHRCLSVRRTRLPPHLRLPPRPVQTNTRAIPEKGVAGVSLTFTNGLGLG